VSTTWVDRALLTDTNQEALLDGILQGGGLVESWALKDICDMPNPERREGRLMIQRVALEMVWEAL
jgi:hypothetical protein